MQTATAEKVTDWINKRKKNALVLFPIKEKKAKYLSLFTSLQTFLTLIDLFISLMYAFSSYDKQQAIYMAAYGLI